jgi:hypothetical protein
MIPDDWATQARLDPPGETMRLRTQNAANVQRRLRRSDAFAGFGTGSGFMPG